MMSSLGYYYVFIRHSSYSDHTTNTSDQITVCLSKNEDDFIVPRLLGQLSNLQHRELHIDLFFIAEQPWDSEMSSWKKVLATVSTDLNQIPMTHMVTGQPTP